MADYSPYGIPRPVEVGREVRMERRQASNRALLFALGGVLVLCVCACIGVFGAAYALGLGKSGAPAALSLPSFGGPTSTPTPSGPTPVPFLKSATNRDGLRVTVTAYQPSLPTQGIQIPQGQELALVSLRLENTRKGGGPIKVSPGDFKLVTPEGDSFSSDTQGITTGEMLKDGEIEAGKSIKGDLVFYVYSDLKDLQLEWTSPDGTAIDFKLSR
jgi:uncharacterized protein DUF4352